jgi:hypothetical protein
MNKARTVLWIGCAIGLSLAGLAGFIVLFAARLNSFWIVLAPIIFAVYQIPAAVVFALWKKRVRRNAAVLDDMPEERGDETEDGTPDTFGEKPF